MKRSMRLVNRKIASVWFVSNWSLIHFGLCGFERPRGDFFHKINNSLKNISKKFNLLYIIHTATYLPLCFSFSQAFKNSLDLLILGFPPPPLTYTIIIIGYIQYIPWREIPTTKVRIWKDSINHMFEAEPIVEKHCVCVRCIGMNQSLSFLT